jgi:hypothetical protein
MSLKEQADITVLIWAFNSHTDGRTADAAEIGHRDLGQHCRARAELRLEPGPQHRLHHTGDRDSRLQCRRLDVQCVSSRRSRSITAPIPIASTRAHTMSQVSGRTGLCLTPGLVFRECCAWRECPDICDAADSNGLLRSGMDRAQSFPIVCYMIAAHQPRLSRARYGASLECLRSSQRRLQRRLRVGRHGHCARSRGCRRVLLPYGAARPSTR